MSYPHFPLLVRLTIQAPVEAQDVSMKFSRLLPFAPRSGDTLELWRETLRDDEETTYQLQLDGIVYSFQESAFIVDIVDTNVANSIREGQGAVQAMADMIAYYESFGFYRMKYPTAQVIKRNTDESHD